MWEVLSGAGSLWSSCELRDDVKDHVMTDYMLIIYLVLLYCFLKNPKPLSYMEVWFLIRDM
jgi:hypothetical protein